MFVVSLQFLVQIFNNNNAPYFAMIKTTIQTNLPHPNITSDDTQYHSEIRNITNHVLSPQIQPHVWIRFSPLMIIQTQTLTIKLKTL